MMPVSEWSYGGRNYSVYIDTNNIYLGLDDSIYINVGSFADTGYQFYTASFDSLKGNIYVVINQDTIGGIPSNLSAQKSVTYNYHTSTVFASYLGFPVDYIQIYPNPISTTCNVKLTFPQYTNRQSLRLQVMDLSAKVYLDTYVLNGNTETFNTSILPSNKEEYFVVISYSGTFLGVKPFIY